MNTDQCKSLVSPHHVGRRKGDSGTKDAILLISRRLFAERGFKGTTFRDIAAQAAVDTGLIRHFFGNKAKLFEATLELPAEAYASFKNAFAGDRVTLGERITREFLCLWLQPETSAVLRATFRSSVASESDSSILANFLESKFGMDFAPNIRQDRAQLRTQLAFSFLSGVALSYFVIKMVPIAAMNQEELVSILSPTTQHFLWGDI